MDADGACCCWPASDRRDARSGVGLIVGLLVVF